MDVLEKKTVPAGNRTVNVQLTIAEYDSDQSSWACGAEIDDLLLPGRTLIDSHRIRCRLHLPDPASVVVLADGGAYLEARAAMRYKPMPTVEPHPSKWRVYISDNATRQLRLVDEYADPRHALSWCEEMNRAGSPTCVMAFVVPPAIEAVH